MVTVRNQDDIIVATLHLRICSIKIIVVWLHFTFNIAKFVHYSTYFNNKHFIL